MSGNAFEFVPGVTVEAGDRDMTILARWEDFLAYNRQFAALRFEYTGRTVIAGRHEQCTQPPLTFAGIERRNAHGFLLGAEARPNLLNSNWFSNPMWEGLSLTRPGYFPNEIGAAA